MGVSVYNVKIKPANGAYRELPRVQSVSFEDGFSFAKETCAARDEGIDSPKYSHVVTGPSNSNGITFEIQGKCSWPEFLEMRPLLRGDFGVSVESGGVTKTFPNSQISDSVQFEMRAADAAWERGVPVWPYSIVVFSRDIGD